MVIGFTGTRNGMTSDQMKTFKRLIAILKPSRFDHGACLGADEDAVAIVYKDFDPVLIHARPGVSASGVKNQDRSKYAIEYSVKVHPEETHFARNRKIVGSADVMIACPPCRPMPTNGGTAYTVNETMKVGKPLFVIWPDGLMSILEKD